MNSRHFFTSVGLICVVLFWNEFLVYYVTLLQCGWPQLDGSKGTFARSSTKASKVMFLADTHVYGSRAHWFDRLRREWQMYRSFQTAAFMFSPEIIFILGDVMDEGKWSQDSEYVETVRRIQQLFSHSPDVRVYIVAGNHDIGFHYMASSANVYRFEKTFVSDSVSLINVDGSYFVLLNSIAFEGDNCSLCAHAQRQLATLSEQLQCIEKTGRNCSGHAENQYSPPIIIQHFPMFRRDDSECEGDDSAAADEKYQLMKPKYDCLSQEATDQILSLLRPRLVVDAHTHNFCQRTLPGNIPEWTVSSFNWRNRNNPTFLLSVITPTDFKMSKCYLPKESTVIATYVMFGLIILLYLATSLRSSSKQKHTFRQALKKH